MSKTSPKAVDDHEEDLDRRHHSIKLEVSRGLFCSKTGRVLLNLLVKDNLARRLTPYLTENKYINTSIQKECVPFQGVWNRISHLN